MAEFFPFLGILVVNLLEQAIFHFPRLYLCFIHTQLIFLPIEKLAMNYKGLSIAGLRLLLPFSLCLTPLRASAQYACGVDDPNQGNRGVVEYYYIQEEDGRGIGCSPQYGGQWHAYYGDPGSGGVWEIAGTAVLFRSIYTYSEIQPAGAIDALPIQISQ